MLKNRIPPGILTHVFFVSLLLVVPTIAFVRPPGEAFFPMSKIFVQDTTANFVLLCFFYLNYYILLPRLFFTHKYLLYAASVLLFLSFAFTLPFLAGRYISGGEQPPPFWAGERPIPFSKPGAPPSIGSFVFDEFRRHLFLFFTAVFLSFLLKTRARLSAVKGEKLIAELSSLKLQINPHFLFNTLNSIYALSIKKDPKAAEAITNLSGLMRYVIKDANDYTIPLKKEIEYVRNYIELQKARLGNTAVIDFETTGEPGNKEIAPLILITYIENAFKYGINPDAGNCIIRVKIQMQDEGIKLTVFNKKVLRAAHLESTGIGMKNTAERLRHLYPEKHILLVNDNQENYSVTLSIKLV